MLFSSLLFLLTQELLKRLSIASFDEYLPGNWQPYCPLALSLPLSRLPDTLSALHTQQFPFTGHLCDIGLVENSDAIALTREHYTFPLGGNFS